MAKLRLAWSSKATMVSVLGSSARMAWASWRVPGSRVNWLLSPTARLFLRVFVTRLIANWVRSGLVGEMGCF